MKRVISLYIILTLIFSMGVVSFAELTPLLSYTFEDISKDGWNYWSTTAEKNTYPVADAYVEGSKSLFLYDTSKTAGTGIKSEYFNVTEGQEYTVLASFYVVKTKIRLYLRYFNAKGTQLSNNSIAVTPGSSWEEKGITVKAPQGAVKGLFIICTDNGDIAGGYIDDVKVLSGNVTPKGAISGTIPKKPPVIDEVVENVEIIDDGYTDGQIIYSEDFEEGTASISNWTTYADSTSYKVVNKKASQGSYSLYVKDSSNAKSAGAYSESFKVAQGNTYTVYSDMFNSVRGIVLYIRFYNAAGSQVGQDGSTFDAIGWINARVSAIAPVGAVTAKVLICGNIADLGEAYFDNIRVYKGQIIKRHPEYEYSEPLQYSPVDSHIVAPVNNKLMYNTYNGKGDKLSDFSYAGFYGGEVELPDTDKLPLFKTLSPSGTNDDTALIQSAIDEAYASSKDTRMKVLKLKAGIYYINRTGIKMKSGIVLSGEGQGPTGTILYAKDNAEYNVIEFFGSDPKKLTTDILITDNYVKAGSKEFTVADASKLKVGDIIRIVHPSTDEWITAMKMKNVNTVYGDTLSWNKGELDNKTERIITGISGNKITINYGLFIPYDKTYSQSYIHAVDDSGYLREIGIENLRVKSYFNGDPLDLNHAKMAIYTKRSKNVFVRNVTAENMFNGVFGCRVSSQISVINCLNIDPVSTIVGGNRYPFYADVDSEKILFSGCYSYDGRHDYMAVKGTSGPIVFLDSIADMSNAASETHAGFATGVLYDNIYQINDKGNGYIAMANRGYYGTETPQGWTAGGSVAWNCLSNSIIVNKPPLTYENFMVGTWGVYNTETSEEVKTSQLEGYKNSAYRYTGVDKGPDSAFATNKGTSLVGDAYKEAEFTPVNPQSLYKAQLSERFTGVISNAKPNAPIIVYPRPDKKVSKDESSVTISGIFKKGASKVSVFVDDVKYNATLNTSDSSFAVTLSLSDGVHKIYATQTIDNLEGNKTADRFIIVNDMGNANPSYLNSDYDTSLMSLINNDTRLTYDEHIIENAHLYPVELSGEGTDENPYIIDSLFKFNQVFKKGAVAPKDKVYLLTGFDKEPLYLSESFKPLTVAFSGKLIGGNMENGKVVNVAQKIDLGTFTTGSTEYVTVEKNARGGLINFMDGATVKNLELYGNITVTNTTGYFGTLAGCISGSLVDNVSNYATIKDGQYWATAGIIGRAKTSSYITNCTNYGTITLPEATTTRVNVGGIVGLMENSNISKCYNFADIHGRDNAGGIIGSRKQGAVSLCGNYGNVTASKKNGTAYSGGIIGRTDGADSPLNASFNTGNISSANYAGALIGQTNPSKTDSVSDCFNLGYVKGASGSGLVVGRNSGSLLVSVFYDLGNQDLKVLSGENKVTFTNCYSVGNNSSDATLSDIAKKSERFISYLKINDKAFSDKWTVREDFSYPTLTDNPLNVSFINFESDKIKVNPFIKAETDANEELFVSGMLYENTDASGVTFLAVYDSHGGMIAVKNVTDLIYDKFNINIKNMKKAHSVKVFTWKLSALMPLENMLDCIVTTK